MGDRSQLNGDRPDIIISEGIFRKRADGSRELIETTSPVAYQPGMEAAIIERRKAALNPASAATDTAKLFKGSKTTATTTTTQVPTPTDSQAAITTGENLMPKSKKRPIMVSKYRKDKNSPKIIKRAKNKGIPKTLSSTGIETGNGADTSIATPHTTIEAKKVTEAKAKKKANITTVTTATPPLGTGSTAQEGNLSTFSEVDQTPDSPLAQTIQCAKESYQPQRRRPSQAPLKIDRNVYRTILDWSVHPTVQSTDFNHNLAEYKKISLDPITTASTFMQSLPSSTSRQATNSQDSAGPRAVTENRSDSLDLNADLGDFVAKRSRSRRRIGFDALDEEMDSKSRTSSSSRSSRNRDSDYRSRESQSDGYRPNDRSSYGATPPFISRQSLPAWAGSSSPSSSSLSSSQVLSTLRSPTGYRKPLSAQNDVALDYANGSIEQQPLKLQKTASKSTSPASKSTAAASKPTAAASKPTTAAPKPTTAAPKPTAAAPKPTAAASKPTAAAYKPVPDPAPPTQLGLATLGRVSESNEYEIYFHNKLRPPQQRKSLVASTPPIWVVMDEANSPSTMGNIIECASTLGVDGIAVHTKSCAPLTAQDLQKMRLNARVNESNPLFHITSIIKFIKACAAQANGWHVVGAHKTHGSKRSLPYNVWPSTGVNRPTILILGDSCMSISKQAARHCDMFVDFPTRHNMGKKFSLESSVAAGIVLDRMLAGRYL
ncbi:hypothetical protein BGZ50_004038 [Haplosporangium sp. Z 11]|nr:hypothetical protein BGZ50_004038 [Haplosporangium sp. Z 11]